MASETIVEESHVGPVVRPARDGDLVILYLHGGPDGPEPALENAQRLAERMGATVVCPRYRSRFPASLIDVHNAYRYSQAAGPVAVVGEGFAAGLAAAAMIQLRDSDATAPLCGVLVSPLLDLTLDQKSVLFNASASPTFDLAELRQRIADYARGTPLNDSHLSPLYANLHGLPPIQLLTAGADPLLDDSLTFATLAARSRVSIGLQVWPETDEFQRNLVPAMTGFITKMFDPRAAEEAGTLA